MLGTKLFFILFASISLFSAQVEIRGHVVDSFGNPLEKVLVTVESLNISVLTDARGSFALSIPSEIHGQDHVTLCFFKETFQQETKIISPGDQAHSLQILMIPFRLLQEQVTVTALNKEEKTLNLPFAQNVVTQSEISESLPESAVEAVSHTPGVSFIGKGGVSVTPSIRGLARRRILLLLDGARIVSDRSAGASAAFVPSSWIERIEVLRSAASVLYGSDAVGGVLQVITEPQSRQTGFHGALQLDGGTVNDRWNASADLGFKKNSLSLNARFQHIDVSNYQTPEGVVDHSGFTYSNADVSVRFETDRRSFSLRFLKSEGRNIGKPDRANDPDKYSFYPYERSNLLLGNFFEKEIAKKTELHFNFFLNPNSYELKKLKVNAAQEDYSQNRSFDNGARLFLRRTAGSNLSFQLGIDCFARFNVKMSNQTFKNGILAEESLPVDNGKRFDTGVYITCDFSGLKKTDIIGGIRWGFFSRSALSNGIFSSNRSQSPAFFLGITRRLSNSMAVFVNLGSAYRVPSLSESFYTGITGRTSIIGNPLLKPERSLNIDCGLKWHTQRIFIAGYFFHYSLSRLIEKFALPGEQYTYENIEKGKILGGELEFQLHLLKNVEFFGHGLYYLGKSPVSETNLNDIPAPRILLGARLWKGRFWSEFDFLWTSAHRHPGPAEVENDSFQVFDFKGGIYLSNHFNLFIKAGNLFNTLYYPNTDPDTPFARGFDLSAGITARF